MYKQMSVLDEVAKLFPDFNWVAKDKDGRVFLFENKPQITHL